MFLRIFKHLLPNARAWRITVEKQLRRFFNGLTGIGEDAKLFFDLVWLDVFPETTRELDAWEQQWGLPNTVITEQERRGRLDGAWKAKGGQDPRYLQDTLQAAGFDVYIHEWWELPFCFYVAECGEAVAECGEPAAEAGATIKCELGRIEVFAAECGEAVAECGEPAAEAGAVVDVLFSGEPTPRNPFDVLSDSVTFTGYTLSCGAASAVCGGTSAISGASASATGKLLVNKPVKQAYNIPTDSNDWRYILYIGGATYGQKASIPAARREEFEALCLKICPAQQWIGLIVEYN